MELITRRAHSSRMQIEPDFFPDSRQKFKPVQHSNSGHSKEADAIFSSLRELRIPALSFASLQLSLSLQKSGFGGTH